MCTVLPELYWVGCVGQQGQQNVIHPRVNYCMNTQHKQGNWTEASSFPCFSTGPYYVLEQNWNTFTALVFEEILQNNEQAHQMMVSLDKSDYHLLRLYYAEPLPKICLSKPVNGNPSSYQSTHLCGSKEHRQCIKMMMHHLNARQKDYFMLGLKQSCWTFFCQRQTLSTVYTCQRLNENGVTKGKERSLSRLHILLNSKNKNEWKKNCKKQ